MSECGKTRTRKNSVFGQFSRSVYPQDFVDFLLRKYFRFLDDIFNKWLENFDEQTRKYDTECSNEHSSLSTLRSKGLSRSNMKW